MNIYQQALKHYGEEAQIIKSIEESAELQVELAKNLNGKNNVQAIAEEIADNEIMFDQMKENFSIHKLVEQFKAQKLARLRDRIEKSKYKE